MAIILGTNGVDTELNLESNSHDNSQADTYYLGFGDDNLDAGNGNDVVYGGEGADTIDGGAGADKIYGGDGEDQLTGGSGVDEMYGGDGADTFSDVTAGDVIFGGPGIDQVDFSSETDPLTINLSTGSLDGVSASIESIEGVVGGSGGDTITGTSTSNNIEGGEGNDVIEGLGGGDVIDCGNGTGDTVSYASDSTGVSVNLATVGNGTANDGVNDQEDGDAEGDDIQNCENLTGGSAGDTLTGDSSANVLNGGGGGDTISGGGGADDIDGGAGADIINGDGGADTVDAGEGADTVVSGGHTNTWGVNDAEVGSDDDDTLSFVSVTDADCSVTVDLSTIADQMGAISTVAAPGDADSACARDGEDDVVKYFENVTGGAGRDSLTGDAGVNTINGGGENDTINGAGGNDVLSGDEGIDTIDGGEGADDINGGAGADIINGGDGADTVDAGEGSDTVVSGGHTGTWDSGETTVVGDNNDTLSFASVTDADCSVTVVLSDADQMGAISTVAAPGDADSTCARSGENDVVRYFENVTGGAGRDSLTGDTGANTINGGGENDTINGAAGNDVLNGDAGDDTINGGADNDTISGGLGADTLNGDAGIDIINGSSGADTINGGADADIINGGADADTVDAGEGADTVVSGGHTGTWGVDDAEVGSDNDDTLSFASVTDADCSVTVDLSAIGDQMGEIETTNVADNTCARDEENDVVKYFENVTGGAGRDSLTGDAGANTINGGGENDTINGAGDNDVLNGDAGDDTINGGADNDAISGGLGADTLNGDAGIDTISGDAGADTINGGDDADIINGGADADTIDAGAGSDTVVSGGHTNTWGVNDAEVGSDNNDTLSFASVTDADCSVNVNLGDSDQMGDISTVAAPGDADSTCARHGENDVVKYFENVTGGAGNDSLTGDAGNNTINGGAGDDTIHTGNGVNIVNGGDGNDDITGGIGGDTINGDAGDDDINCGAGNDTVDGGDDDDVITDSGGTNTLDGGDGDDTITGGVGKDTINGGIGNDVIDGKLTADIVCTVDRNDANILNGDDGNDIFEVSELGENIFTGGDDVDTVDYTKLTSSYIEIYSADDDVTDNLFGAKCHVFNNIEKIKGTVGPDKIFAFSGLNAIHAGNGNDRIEAGSVDNIYLEAGDGGDTLVGDSGSNVQAFVLSDKSLTNWFTEVLNFNDANDKIGLLANLCGDTVPATDEGLYTAGVTVNFVSVGAVAPNGEIWRGTATDLTTVNGGGALNDPDAKCIFISGTGTGRGEIHHKADGDWTGGASQSTLLAKIYKDGSLLDLGLLGADDIMVLAGDYFTTDLNGPAA